MVGFALGNDGKNVNEEYLQRRQTVLRETMNLEEHGEIEIERYDLDELEFTGKENPRTYITKHSISDDEVDVSGFDVRDLPTHE